MKKPIFCSTKCATIAALITPIIGPIQSPFCPPTMTSVPVGLQGTAQIGNRAIADVIENQVVALRALREIFLRVIDDPVGAERAHQVDVARAAHAGDFGAEMFGDLYRERADAAGRAVDQNLLPRA